MIRATPLRLYALLAVALTLPFRGLLGDPDVDVWNHVWGYWWFAHALASFELPWRTALMGAPNGGVLWFVDPVGALVALPATLIFGPATAYTAVLLARVALAGLAGHALCARVFGRGPHAYVAGAAFASAPFLWCELANGISEVTTVWYVPAALVATIRAAESDRTRDHVLAGVAVGAATLANFYYGLTAGLLAATYWLVAVHPLATLARRAATAGAVAAVLAAPGLLALRASVAAPDALVRRSASKNLEFAVHNAVDPRVFVTPGRFSSVDLQARYGEPFRHTGYLRLSVLALAGLAWRRSRSRNAPPSRRIAPLLACAGVSLALALGPYLWWGDGWVKVRGNVLSLPFEWLQDAVPGLAITHPLRLSVGAQAVACALAGGALAGRRRLVPIVATVTVLEGLLGSNARWPLPTAPTDIPDFYAAIAANPDPRAVLDLPPEVGTTMATSRYFLFQTVHRHPVPYEVDARAGSTGDPATFSLLPSANGPPGARPGPASPDRATPAFSAEAVAHLRAVYGWIVVHGDLARRAGAEGVYESVFTPILGPPETHGDLATWRLPPAGAASSEPGDRGRTVSGPDAGSGPDHPRNPPAPR